MSVQDISHLLFECIRLSDEKNEWRGRCEKVGVNFNTSGFRQPIDECLGLDKIGECLKRMVECTIEMNDNCVLYGYPPLFKNNHNLQI